MKHITTLIARGMKFEIVKDERGYWAIEDKYITDGKLNTQINGITGCLKDNLNDCIEQAKIRAEVHYLIEVEGVDRMDAVRIAVLGA